MKEDPTPFEKFMIMMWAATFIIGLIISLGNGIGWMWDVKTFKAECVRRQVAEWVLDPETGKTEWKWLPPTTPTR